MSTPADGASINTTFCSLCDTFLNGNAKGDVTLLTATLDSIAGDLARNENLRAQMGGNSPSIWPSLRQLWDVSAEQVTSQEDDVSTQTLVTSIARFTRNLVAGIPTNQQNAFENEPSLRRILYAYSSWSATQDPQSYAVTRMSVQTLSNMVTSNEILMSRLWDTYMNLPEEQVVLVRLLGSPDTRTVLSLLVLLVNCIHESIQRRTLLAGSPVGARICISLLDRMVTLYDAEDASDEGKAFDYGYHLFAHLFEGGFAPELYANLKVAEEVIVPHQTTLLKLLDSYLQSSHCSSALAGMCPMLTACFFELATFSRESVRKSIGTLPVENADEDPEGNVPVPEILDLLLPKACEALVLVTQCIVSIMLTVEEISTSEISENDFQPLIRDAVSPRGECIVLLRLLDIFLPRINFGKPVVSPRASQDHVSPAASDPTGFSYLKRDLVRLVSILCHKDGSTQDRVRSCGGIPVIMSMCVVDERNPYLREHAIFALHNLLEDNEENQAVVNSIQPSGT
ncbi:spinocerebellar ataxia type 10 protein domain-containing protein [Melanogaster broomeanus]|nr:spinocerebellar ataxia type 10 protein domain-containing protein [Melanogaster broomeanus]